MLALLLLSSSSLLPNAILLSVDDLTRILVTWNRSFIEHNWEFNRTPYASDIFYYKILNWCNLVYRKHKLRIPFNGSNLVAEISSLSPVSSTLSHATTSICILMLTSCSCNFVDMMKWNQRIAAGIYEVITSSWIHNMWPSTPRWWTLKCSLNCSNIIYMHKKI